MTRYVLDADAVMAFLEDRPGASVVEELLKRSIDVHRPLLMSVVGWGSVFQAILKQYGETVAEAKMRELQQLSIELVDADPALCTLAASIATKLNLSYMNCFAPAVALQRKATLVMTNNETKLPQGLNTLVAK